MNSLINITANSQGESVVSARELHSFLDSKQQFADWIKKRIKKYGLKEGQDYAIVPPTSENDSAVFHSVMKNSTGGRSSIEYVLTVDAAKELAMVEGNAKGKVARQYFIDCEKALRHMTALSSGFDRHRLDKLEQQVKQMLELQQQAARSLLDLPRSTEAVPIETTRAKIQRLVNSYCRAKGVSQQDTWRKVYDRLYYAYRVSIRSYRRSERESWLDVAERTGHIEKIYAIASTELGLAVQAAT